MWPTRAPRLPGARPVTGPASSSPSIRWVLSGRLRTAARGGQTPESAGTERSSAAVAGTRATLAQGPRQAEHDVLLTAHDLAGHFATPAAQPLDHLLHQQLRRR